MGESSGDAEAPFPSPCLGDKNHKYPGSPQVDPQRPEQLVQYCSSLVRVIESSNSREEARLIAIRMGPPSQGLQTQVKEVLVYPQQLAQYWACIARAIDNCSGQEDAWLIAVRMPPPQAPAYGATISSHLEQQPGLLLILQLQHGGQHLLSLYVGAAVISSTIERERPQLR